MVSTPGSFGNVSRRDGQALSPHGEETYKDLNYLNDAYKRRQCGPVVRALAFRSGDPGFKTRSDHSLNLIMVVPGSTSQLHL